mgnify:CR=1 FL=1
MSAKPARYYVRSGDGRAIYGFGVAEAAETAALAYGDGAHIVDTLAKSYQPMLSEVMGGKVRIAGISGWDTGKPGRLDHDFIEAAKKHVALAHAFLEKGADVNARDANGGTALHWAVGGNKPDVAALLLEKGAEKDAADGAGQTPLALATKLGRKKLIPLLEEAGG